MLTLLFDGVAYGMLLFVLAVGLAVTLGLMNFINLAHGAFAMAGGYITVLLMNRAGVPFLACLPLAFIGAGAARRGARADALPAHVRPAAPRPGAVLDRPGLHGGDRGRLLRRLDAAEHPAAGLAAGPLRHRVGRHRPLPPLHHRRLRGAGARRCNGCWSRTRFGSRLRAAVDDRRVASGLGLDVNRIFLATFAVGSGLAGLGGALGAEVLGLDPSFPLKFMIYFLIVCAVGGTTTITGPLLAALLLGIADVMGKYYVPKLGAFIVYTLMIADPAGAAAGPVRARRGGAVSGAAARRWRSDARWRWWELATLRRAAGGVAAAAGPGADPQRDRHPGAVRALARPDPRLRRHRLARPCRLLRPRRLHRGAVAPSMVMPDPWLGMAAAVGAVGRCSAS